ncbi:MAG: ABC transporter ATP-binding protein [Sulfobacillus benefaciens]|uniref:ABC transporter ATP-binding protein n=1 Tax=Sulfobacillus benefaciens TaxID=453960 RepID=A0A2T2X6B4_9FIRM|nr:MAG: ABC transporter ATP-binding protein [Sulfobacillus benefaciens]HBQ94280.1 ABC transporter ATP-binding protein [Sulfobacillus sp.]
MTLPLVIDQLSFRWKTTRDRLGPLSGIFSPGRITAVIGPNGAGKSTFLRLLGAFLKPLSGTVRYGGEDLIHLSPSARARILTLVPQVLPIGFDLRVRELLSLGTYVHRSWRERILDSLPSPEIGKVVGRLQLQELVDKPYNQLSGGEAQRALLGMALVQDTSILLLDEPTAHLDPGHAQILMAYLQELARVDRKIIVLAYHDLATVGLFADTIWLMDKGQVVLAGQSEEVLASDIIQKIYGVQFHLVRHPVTQRITLLLP